MSYDPFPKTGLIKQYETFIRGQARAYSKKYPRLGYEALLVEAVRLAHRAEELFKPEKGKYGTILLWHLKGLQRFAEQEGKHTSIEITEDETSRQRVEGEERGEQPRPVNFGPRQPAGPDYAVVGNGARLTFDRQWVRTNSARVSGSFTPIQRHRVVVGTQLQSTARAHAHGVTERIAANLEVLLNNPDGVRAGQLRAIVDDAKRCQKEAEQEAENQKVGDFRPVFLEAQRTWVDVGFYRGRKPPKFEPNRIAIARLDDAYGHDEEWVLKLHETIAAGVGVSSDEDFERRLRAAIEAERSFLSQHESAVLAWMLDARGRNLTTFAGEAGISKGYASKIQKKLLQILKTRLQK